MNKATYRVIHFDKQGTNVTNLFYAIPFDEKDHAADWVRHYVDNADIDIGDVISAVEHVE
jgi:hypothetical protein